MSPDTGSGVPVPARNDLDVRVMAAALGRRMFGEVADVPVRIARFLVVDRIGGGGMGTVFRAYDPELDRSVAVKVLRLDIARDDPGAARRMQREAMALARLSHPNVVTIHEVGTTDDRTFLAMEYVQGQDLAQWMRAHPPGDASRFAAAMELLLQAGRGLAAAHSAGLVHRDFKPSNVLVGDDGRVRVADFGLVRAAADPEIVEDTVPTIVVSDESRVTQAGALVGTLRYMAPEQQRGRTVDARSDQFSFCVTAWELLFGALPWPDGVADEPASIPERAPRWVVAVLQRGLEHDPQRRHQHLSALLGALARDPRRRQRLAVLGVGALAAIGVGVGVFAHHRSTMCDDGAAALAETWNDDRRAVLEQHSGANDDDATRDAWARTGARVQVVADEWQATWTSVCEAGRKRSELATETMDAAFGCLDLRRVELDATLDVLETGGRETAAYATSIAFELPSPRGCESGSPSEAMRLPEDPARARAVLVATRDLIGARLTGETDDWALALTRLDELAPRVAELDHLPLSLRAMEVRAIALMQLERYADAKEVLLDAYWLALRNGEDAMAAAFARRLSGMASVGSEIDRAQEWIDYARALGERAGVGPTERARVELAAAQVLTMRGDFSAALTSLDASLALADTTWGDDHPDAAAIHLGRATVLRRMNQHAAAAYASRKALAIRQAALGPRALATTYPMASLAASLSRLGQHDEALALNREIVAIRGQWLVADHLQIASAFADLGASAAFAERHEDAADALHRAVAIYTHVLPEAHELRLLARHNLAQMIGALGDIDESVAIEQDVVRLFERERGPEHPRVAMALWGLGESLGRRGDVEAARAALARSLAIYTETVGEVHADTINVRVALAKLELDRGEPALAAAAIAAVIEVATGDAVAPARGDALALQGRVLEQLGRPAEALASYEDALPLLRGPQSRADAQARIAALDG